MAITSSKNQTIACEHMSKKYEDAYVLKVRRARFYVIAAAWPLFSIVHTDELAAFHAGGPNGIVIAGRGQDQSLMRVGQSGADFSVEDISGLSGQPLKLNISVSEDVLKTAQNPGGPVFMMFHGLPAKLSFSAGFRVKDAWAVSLKDIPQLTLSTDPDYNGTFNVTATLHRGKQATSVIYAFQVTLVSVKEAASETRPVTAPLPNVVFASPETEKAALPVAQAAELLTRAESLFKNGDFVAARLMFGELAERGIQKAALRMAESYDPEVLKSFFIVGIKPNPEKARQWYTRAMELGAIEARDRLNLLSKAETK
jgi:hypothetical protein